MNVQVIYNFLQRQLAVSGSNWNNSYISHLLFSFSKHTALKSRAKSFLEEGCHHLHWFTCPRELKSIYTRKGLNFLAHMHMSKRVMICCYLSTLAIVVGFLVYIEDNIVDTLFARLESGVMFAHWSGTRETLYLLLLLNQECVKIWLISTFEAVE